jgi:hypothetical protein
MEQVRILEVFDNVHSDFALKVTPEEQDIPGTGYSVPL